MNDFDSWYREVGFCIIPEDDENFFQFKKRLLQLAFNAGKEFIKDDGR